MSERWKRVSKRARCPICGKPDWCLLSPDGTAAICARVESTKAAGSKGAGWLHDLSGAVERPPALVRNEPPPRRLSSYEWERMADVFWESCTTTRKQVLASALGISEYALGALFVGYSHDREAYTFPMFDGLANVVGIRLRNMTGRKWCMPGSRNGLFIPAYRREEPLMICEGPTDTAALFDAGYWSIGRPSCTGGVDFISQYVDRLRPGSVVVCADRDKPGQAGAAELARRLVVWGFRVRIVTPPAKDARAWAAAGAKRADWQRLIAAAKPER